mgnify:CR=1 FL=1
MSNKKPLCKIKYQQPYSIELICDNEALKEKEIEKEHHKQKREAKYLSKKKPKKNSAGFSSIPERSGR